LSWASRAGKAVTDSSHPRAFGVCDRCGQWTNNHKLRWQFQWNATKLYNQRLLVCRDCYDDPQQQLRTLILPPDPSPLANIRPEFFKKDESNPTQNLLAQIVTAQVSITTFFVDLYNGNPAQGGSSILSSLTGSATRIDAASRMTTVGSVARNTSAISITTTAQASGNAVYVAIFNASTAGTLLMSAQLLPPQTIVMWNGAQFPVGALQVTLGA
jgi:hypothetical protein